ncbi:hypothetical protein LEMLEM_LOCUS27207 [Lemmus lemmus]
MGIVSRVDQLVLKSGKWVWSGYKETLKMIRQGKLNLPTPTTTVQL